MKNKLAIVVSYRNRDITRVKYFLLSLKQQSVDDFNLIFVDYGSSTSCSHEIEKVVSQYSFAKYIYADHRGWPWCRSHALNIGVRDAETDYILTTDVDIYFPKDFISVLLEHAAENVLLQCSHYFLPYGFDDWENITDYKDKLGRDPKFGLGSCQCFPRQKFIEIRGFDEYYKFWGREDVDLNNRFKNSGLKEVWLNDNTEIFHQYHSFSDDISRQGFCSDFINGRRIPHIIAANKFLYYHKNLNTIVRNNEQWGSHFTRENRPLLDYVSIEEKILTNKDRTIYVNLPSDKTASVRPFLKIFMNATSKQMLAVDNAFFPKKNDALDDMLAQKNKELKHFDHKIGYLPNILHSFLCEFVTQNSESIVDYYFAFPGCNGLTFILKK